MPRTHPYLLGLAETRARADSRCSTFEAQIAVLSRRLANSREERDACDSLIRRFDPTILPEAIPPIKEGYRPRYGPRGALTNAIKAALQQAYPKSITTSEIALHVEAAFQLTFTTRTERRNWVCRAISPRLGSFVHDNIIERLHNPNARDGKVGHWRWIPKGELPTDLRTLAAKAGLAATFARGQDALEPEPEDDDLPR